MSKTLWDCHLEVIKLLEERGEKVRMPINRARMGGTPEIYIKSIPYPSNDFRIGTGLKKKDGTFELIGEHLCWIISGLSIDELGLCDSALEMENYDLLPPKKIQKTCPLCHGTGMVP